MEEVGVRVQGSMELHSFQEDLHQKPAKSALVNFMLPHNSVKDNIVISQSIFSNNSMEIMMSLYSVEVNLRLNKFRALFIQSIKHCNCSSQCHF